MSTRSRIGMVLPDGKIKSIYCHSDGYLSYNGRILCTDFRDRTKVEQLLDLGDISSLHPQVAPPPGVKHSYLDRVLGVTVAYKRDRGENDVDPVISANEEAFLALDSGQEFSYLYGTDGLWRVWEAHDGSELQGAELTPQVIAEALHA
jgi:hypothetical protein